MCLCAILTDDADDGNKTEISDVVMYSWLGAHVQSGVRVRHILDVQHQHVPLPMGAESGDVVRRIRAAAYAVFPTAAARHVHPTSDGHHGQVDVPVVSSGRPVVVRHAAEVESAADLYHRVVRANCVQHRYANAPYVYANVHAQF